MTRDETKKIIMLISATYPNFKPADLTFTVDAWAVMFEGYDYNRVEAALKDYITSDTSGFAPSIGQLVDKMHALTKRANIKKIELKMLCGNNNGINGKNPFGIIEKTGGRDRE